MKVADYEDYEGCHQLAEDYKKDYEGCDKHDEDYDRHNEDKNRW